MAGILSTAVSNAKFRPFSYQEMLAPLAAYTQEYNNVQEGLSGLGDASNTFGQYLTGTQAGKVVDEYNQKLKTAFEDMNQNGLGATNRGTLYDLKRQYNSDILNINKAAQSLDAMNKTIQQGKLANPSLMTGKLPTVDELLANPTSAPTVVNGEEMYAHAAKSAQAASARKFLTDNTVGQGIMQYYIHNVVRNGYNPEDLDKFQRMVKDIPELSGAISSIKTMYNTQNLGSTDQARSDAYIMRGIMDGAGYQVKDQYMANPEANAALDFNYYQKKSEVQDQLSANQQQRDAYYKGIVDENGNLITKTTPDPTGISSNEDMKTDGRYSEVSKGLQTLRATKGGLAADVFGKTFGTINPMKVKELADAAYNNTILSDNQYAEPGIQKNKQPSRDTSVKAEQARQAVLKKYGVDRTLSNEEYASLKQLGYNSNMNAKQFYGGHSYGSQWLAGLNNKLNDMSQSTTTYTINGTTVNDRLNNRVATNGMDIYNNNPKNAVIKEFDSSTHKPEKNVDLADVIKDMQPDDVYGYSWTHGDGITYMSRKTGKKYWLDPSLFSSEARDLIKDRKNKLEQQVYAYEHTTPYGELSNTKVRNCSENQKSEFKKMLSTQIIHGLGAMVAQDVMQAAPLTSAKNQE